ncbi:hypothetical protein DPM19_13810 [Actinomadura craniellae]|uniref:DUF2269 domain-containing protein n=1 Tax=Actinomadura craniellae TaxID=2231787 RepID=A0A365H725_9ACTN|nr:DUF2269 family protein [Actinomadura craniellae]RAY14802.1 hypothetical protein DPM19_13810 [Actinomadura craniellae]
MSKLLLSLHVLAAVLFIGPVTVAASMFPARARAALAADADRPAAVASVRMLYRITRVYAIMGLTVPALGFFTAQSMGVLGDPWLLVSIALTAVAVGVLLLVVLPRQEGVLEALDGTGPDPATLSRLAMFTGMYSLLWTVVVVLMVVRPGSTTGA